MGDRLAEVGRFLVLCRFDLPARFRQASTRLGSDAAAAIVDVLGHGVHPRLRGEQRLFQSALALVNPVNEASGSDEPLARARSRAWAAAVRALARSRRCGALACWAFCSAVLACSMPDCVSVIRDGSV